VRAFWQLHHAITQHARVFPRCSAELGLQIDLTNVQGHDDAFPPSRAFARTRETSEVARIAKLIVRVFFDGARARKKMLATTKGDGVVPIVRMPLSIPGLRGGVYKSHHQMTGAARGTTSQTFLTRGGSIVVHPPAFFLGPSGVRDPAESHPSRPAPRRQTAPDVCEATRNAYLADRALTDASESLSRRVSSSSASADEREAATHPPSPVMDDAGTEHHFAPIRV